MNFLSRYGKCYFLESRVLQGICRIFPLVLFLSASPLFSQNYRETKLIAPDGAELDIFGNSVAVSGYWIAVGAPWRDDLGSNSGAVYMFRRRGNTWNFSQKLLASDGGADQIFGRVSLDGEYLAVGAPRALYNSIPSGATYIFKLVDTAWMEMRKIGPQPTVSGATFGLPVSLHQNYVLIGARDDREGDKQSGAAYVFVKSGENWVQQVRLLASDRKDMQLFGADVSLWDSIAFVGAPYDSNRNGSFAGAGYIFKRIGSTWNEITKLVATNGLPEDLASTVALHGSYAALGAPGSVRVSRPGVVYAFKTDGASWIQHQTTSASDGMDQNRYGQAVVMGSFQMLVGAEGDTTNGVGAGAAYLLTKKDTTWVEKFKFLASDGAAGANYGHAVARSDSSIVIGALFARIGGVNKGAAYVYDQTVVGVAENEELPNEFHLHQNFPNPFNPSTEIRWQIPDARWVTLRVYDLVGREVAKLVDEMKAAGKYSAVFDAHSLSSGVYYYRLMAGQPQQTRKMLLIK